MSAEGRPTTRRTIVWVRCSDPAKLPAVMALDDELQQDERSTWLEITLPKAQGDALSHPVGQKGVRAYCDHLRPDAVLWVGGQFDPSTLSVCHELNLPVIVVDAGIAMLPRMARGWFPGKTRALLSQLHTVLARTEDAASGLTRAGVDSGAIQITGSLEETGGVLKWDEDVRYELAQKIGPRPIWLAAHIDEGEAKHIAAAHRHASLRAHRLLCVVTSQALTSQLKETFKSAGLNVSVEAKGDTLDESTQIYIANGIEHHGLWTRLAPITFVGGSHTSGARIDPFHVATVGSVVVHGHLKGAFSAHFDRLMNADATFICDRFENLGPAVSQLLSADMAAKYAAAGWDVTSSGAEVVNLLSQTIRDAVRNRDVAG